MKGFRIDERGRSYFVGSSGEEPAKPVVKDMKKDINMPFVINIDKNGMLNLVAKTIIRKKDFKTTSMELPV